MRHLKYPWSWFETQICYNCCEKSSSRDEKLTATTELVWYGKPHKQIQTDFMGTNENYLHEFTLL